jgi:hypothetical protein
MKMKLMMKKSLLRVFVMLLLSIFQQEIYDMQLDHKRGMGAATRNKEPDEAKTGKGRRRKEMRIDEDEEEKRAGMRSMSPVHAEPASQSLPDLFMI